jgi:hypothetical protein
MQAHHSTTACFVKRSGYRLRSFTADAQSLQLQDGPYEVTRLAVEEARLAWPCWQSVQLQARGLRVELLQRQMPEVRATRSRCRRSCMWLLYTTVLVCRPFGILVFTSSEATA